jgi:hypothetical protein
MRFHKISLPTFILFDPKLISLYHAYEVAWFWAVTRIIYEMSCFLGALKDFMLFFYAISMISISLLDMSL